MDELFERDLVRGSLDLMVLSVLAEGELYGYRIQKQLHAASGGRASLQAGTLYPLLHRLEADGLVSSREESSTGRKRKWYGLTAKGRRRLHSRAETWRAWARCMLDLLDSVAPDGGTAAAPA